jgi:xanthine dehydrogenase accessory factor
VCGGQVDIFMEPIMPDPTVLVIGCGHVGQAVADLAHWLGFYVIVSDDRADLCNSDVIPHADEYVVVPPAEVANAAPIHRRTYVAAVTRGVPLDVQMVPALLDTPAPYIGVIGSRRRWATTVKQLKEQGVPEDDLARIHAPIGLELNAETPREIAVSIMAEIIGQMRGGSGEAMKWMGEPEEAGSTG